MKNSKIIISLFCILIFTTGTFAQIDNGNKNEEKPVGYNDKPSPELKVWSKYDFVSGHEIIFEDNLSNEKNGEFPSKWDLKKGNAENAVF